MCVFDLNIPYNKKDELKVLKIKWNNERKTWYFDGDKLPEELKPYESKYVDIQYEDKDFFKAKYPSMSFDGIKKMWKMSASDFAIYTK